MSSVPAEDRFPIEPIRRRIGQAGFIIGVVGLTVGVALFLVNQREASAWVLRATVAALLALPIVNVSAVLAEEVRQRDWSFAALAVGVLALLAWAVVSRVAQALQYKSL
jgi:hypothetical protein